MADSPRRSRYKRWRSRTLDFLHTRPVLIVISILILIDCLSLLGQMMSDIQSMQIRFQLEEDNIQVFENHLKMASDNESFPDVSSISDVMIFLRNNMDVILSDRCSSFCVRPSSTENKEVERIGVIRDVNSPKTTPRTTDIPCMNSKHIWIQFNEGAESTFVVGEMDLNFKRHVEHESHGTLGGIYIVSQILNITGVVIVTFMFVEIILRTVCRGRYFYKKKLEVLDSIIGTVAFVLDVSYMFGQWASSPADSATILILLLPWRFGRVIYSLITAMNHQHHIQMKLLKSAKRTSDVRLAHARKLVLQMEKDAQSLTLLCRRKMATDTEIDSCYCRTTTAAVSKFGSTLLMISAPALSESGLYHQGSRGHLFQEVFDEAENVCGDVNNNTTPPTEDVEEPECPRTLRRAGPRVVNVTPPLAYQPLVDRPGAPVSVVEPCRRLLDETSSTDSSEKSSLDRETTYL
ncbi:uncharacterized protein LOC117336488 [Pecten maximus]|uniref:uncharacterized protein LOC117336488 n=1 Tax=Pecten maximus TaxID=6579 RepID=UPI0014587524|nr:uncharacterized protein LOC117336488 [Pecten maximus]